MLSTVLFSLLGFLAEAAATPAPSAVAFTSVPKVHAAGASNIHVEYLSPESVVGEIIYVYGRLHLRDHDGKPTRFVWLTPSELPTGGCLHAFSEVGLLGRSMPINVQWKPLRKRSALSEINDPYGPWFDGVAYLQSKNNTETFVAGKKSQKIGILGGGMAGLMSGLLLDQVGIHDWEISESSQRIGGRLRTAYLNGTSPEDYQYQEMGPMRFPVSLTYAETNETLEIQDHKLVFQLADVLNQINAEVDPAFQVNFIPWVQSNSATYQYQNGLRNPDGTAPRRSEYAELVANASSPATPNPALTAARQDLTNFIAFNNKSRDAAANLFRAHKQAIEDGLMDFSESSFLRAQGLGWNETSAVGGTGTLWSSIYDGVYFAANEWVTVDKGLNRLAEAFHPVVDNRLTYGRRIEALGYNETTGKTSIHWKQDGEKQSREYDKTVVAVPFSVARLWRTPRLSPVMSEAIIGLGYAFACKVALLYQTRFWEHIDPPIFGGCGTTDLPGIGSFCYPAYNINGTGPGALMAAYSTPLGPYTQAMSEEDHVRLVVEAMEEIHGPIAAEQYTGVYDRQCWGLDPDAAGSWASPYTGQHERYMPEYHKTHANHVFIGEHTSINHAWIFSALESAVRGVVQLLLDDGLVDEAQQIVDKWMARWISV